LIRLNLNFQFPSTKKEHQPPKLLLKNPDREKFYCFLGLPEKGLNEKKDLLSL
jgi:hypothetical protein